MRRVVQMITLGILLSAAARAACGQELRMANGMVIAGTAREATADGLVIETIKGPKTYEWATLAPSTRYRYEPKFRANYDSVLRGWPASARTRPPDTEDEAESAAPESRPEESAAPSTSSDSIKLVDQVLYENIEPFPTKDIPELNLRAAEAAAYLGMQYGPGRNETIYFCFDTKSKDELRDTIFIYSPGDEAFKNTVRQKALKKKVAGEYIAGYKKIELSARFGVIEAHYGIRFACHSGRARELGVTIDVDLAARDAKGSFVLYGEPTDLVYGEGVVNVRGILDLPVLWVGLDPASAKPRLIGDLKMSRMKLCPKRGMESAVRITVIDEQAGTKEEENSVKLSEDMFEQEYGIIYNLAKLESGRKYIIRAAIDLGPVLGEVLCEEKITAPAAP